MINPQKVVFLDRDGVINKKQAEGHYVTDVNLFEFNKKIFHVLTHFIKNGYKLIVITNQRGINRGLMSEGDLLRIHGYMKSELQKQGIEILDVFYCPHGFDECSCRKPKPGLLKKATEKYAINLRESVLISDEMRDIEMGRSFGIGENIYIEVDSPEQALC